MVKILQVKKKILKFLHYIYICFKCIFFCYLQNLKFYKKWKKTYFWNFFISSIKNWWSKFVGLWYTGFGASMFKRVILIRATQIKNAKPKRIKIKHVSLYILQELHLFTYKVEGLFIIKNYKHSNKFICYWSVENLKDSWLRIVYGFKFKQMLIIL